MPLICYTPKNFSTGSLEVIENANSIIDDFVADEVERDNEE